MSRAMADWMPGAWRLNVIVMMRIVDKYAGCKSGAIAGNIYLQAEPTK